MTQEELIQELSPIRLPVEYAAFTVQDALLTLSLGLIAGLILAKLIGVLTTRSVSPLDAAQSRIDALASMDPDSRIIGLAEMLGQHAPDQWAKLSASDGLYDPDERLDPTVLEAAILKAVKRGAG